MEYQLPPSPKIDLIYSFKHGLMMRLLSQNSKAEIVLTEFLGSEIPPYAILSHTWGDEEVSFDDLKDNAKIETKRGYQKIQLCMDNAKDDDLQYSWVDTCCIDKSSSVELQEAINSMFAWYRDASKCYVYLTDVFIVVYSSPQEGPPPWEAAFRKSRWFTRSWTLQELLAPPSVEFLDHNGERLGDRNSLAELIHEITSIPVSALKGQPLSEFSIEQRMSWSQGREASRQEDQAYSLFGLFDVSMPMLYGEGMKAVARLNKEILRTELWRDSSILRRERDQSSRTPEDSDSNSSSSIDDIESIFSDSGMSVSSKSSVGPSPVQVSGIREVTSALLSHDGFKSLCTAAISNLAQKKSRAHIKGFLKVYGSNLDAEASNRIEHQAARFVQDVAGRIADEIRWSIIGFEEVKISADTEVEKQSLENWLSDIQQGMGEGSSKANGPEQPNEDDDDDDDSDDEPETTADFSNIDSAREFILSSNAFAALLEALQDWMKVSKRPELHARDRESPRTKDVQNVIMEDRTLHTDVDPTHPTMAVSEKCTLEDDLSNQVVQTPRHEHVLAGFESLVSFSGHLLSYCIPLPLLYRHLRPVAHGYERIIWRCSCKTILWGDFPVDSPEALSQLKRELCHGEFSKMATGTSERTRQIPILEPDPNFPTVQASPGFRENDAPAEPSQTGIIQSPGICSSNSLQSIPSSSASTEGTSSHAVESQLASLTDVIIDSQIPIYFEVWTNIGHHAVCHFELDISQTLTDGQLFEKIWNTYQQSRGFGIKRLFLRPRSVHFVMFSISNKRAARYSAGIHKKPDEYPPDEEIQHQRYHYLSPKIMMPSHTFMHFLYRAQGKNNWGDHADATWLKRLPKKLHESILVAARTPTAAGPVDADLAFGWGVHILDGPHHAMLGFLLAGGLVVSFVVSCLILGLAKTQEQAFGVGQYLVAIVVALMSATYFTLQDL